MQPDALWHKGMSAWITHFQPVRLVALPCDAAPLPGRQAGSHFSPRGRRSMKTKLGCALAALMVFAPMAGLADSEWYIFIGSERCEESVSPARLDRRV